MLRTTRHRANRWPRSSSARLPQSAQDRACAAARKTVVIAYVGKLSCETIALLPPNPMPTSTNNSMSQGTTGVDRELLPYDCADVSLPLMRSSSRWLKHKVKALIRVWSRLDNRPQELRLNREGERAHGGSGERRMESEAVQGEVGEHLTLSHPPLATLHASRTSTSSHLHLPPMVEMERNVRLCCEKSETNRMKNQPK